MSCDCNLLSVTRMVLLWMIIVFPLYDCESVTLTSSGPLTNESTITLCSNEIRRVIFMECIVRGSNSIVWKLQPIYDTVIYSAESEVGLEVSRSPITFSLIEKGEGAEGRVFRSQFQTLSNELYDALERHGGPLRVACRGQSGGDEVLIKLPDEDLPKIISATVDKERNELRVTWSTNSSDIVNIAVIADNVESGIKESVIVEYDQRETSITVNPRISYNVTVILHTKCQQKLTSEVYHTNEHVEELHPTPSKSIQGSPTVMCRSGNKSESGLMATSIALGLLSLILLTICIFLTAFLIWRRLHNQASLLKGGVSQTNPSVQLQDVKKDEIAL